MADAVGRFASADLAEAREATERVRRLFGDAPPASRPDLGEVRRLRSVGGPHLPPPARLPFAEMLTIDGPVGDLALRVLTPENPTNLHLFVHGGGWNTGGADQHDVALWELAQTAESAVVAVDYRLAPEQPWPAAIDDYVSAALWCLDTGRERFGVEALTIGGDSSGAHLAVATLLRLRDDHRAAEAIARANLLFGMYDLSLTPSARSAERGVLLNRQTIEWFVDDFTPGMTPEDRRHPDVSPLYADLHGLPPALFSVGTLDPLLDDTLFMAARWQAAGNATELDVYPESPHGFTTLDTAIARMSATRQAAFLRAGTRR